MIAYTGRFGGRRRRPHPDWNRDPNNPNQSDRSSNLHETTPEIDYIDNENEPSSTVSSVRNNNHPPQTRPDNQPSHYATENTNSYYSSIKPPINNFHNRQKPPQPISTPAPAPVPMINWETVEKICGLRGQARIVGGKETKPNSWLWMASFDF